MDRALTDIAFTPAVRAAQERYGSRALFGRVERMEAETVMLGPREIAFIEARDGFYQATVSETGWPYVQFRGGAVGFLKVIDGRTIGYADLRGNVQYLSVGNMSANDRVALILMDYANRRRLKIWARARVVHPEEDRELVEALSMPDAGGPVERAVVLTVEAFDWNCPKHITPRYTAAEVEAYVRPLLDRIAALEAAAAKD